MMRLAWLTDLHLNFVDLSEVDRLCLRIRDEEAGAVLISGDIAEAPDVVTYLEYLDRWLDRPIFFVLGNHDFYRGGMAEVRARVAELDSHAPWLHWLNLAGVVELTAETGLVGHDGWVDGRLGDYAGSDVLLNDYFLIEELAGLDPGERLERLHGLGAEAADHFRRVLPEALARFQHVIAVTHVPPFRESCWHLGTISGDAWLPHFASKVTGEVLAAVMRMHPDRELLVLCGHTHSSGAAQILPNLKVLTGEAVYGRPEVQGWIILNGTGKLELRKQPRSNGD